MSNGIKLYVLLTKKKNADGTPLTGNYRSVYWLNGVSLNVYSEIEALKHRRLGTAADYKLFKEIPIEEIKEFAENNNLQVAPRERKVPVVENDFPVKEVGISYNNKYH